MENVDKIVKLNKISEIIRNNLNGLNIDIDMENDKKSFFFGYESANDSYYVKVDDENLKNSLTLEEIISFLSDDMFSEKIDKIYLNRILDEEKYEKARIDLLEQLNSVEISNVNKAIIQLIIEQVCQLPDVVGFGNRVYISENEHLRLADDSRFDTKGDKLHLQLVKKIESFVNFTDYPELSFEQLVDYICSKDLLLKNVENNNKSR